MDNKHIFTRIAGKASSLAGSPVASIIAFLTIIIWAVTGPIFGFSDTWQLVINTGTTIITFLMVFLIQNAQNRDSRAVQIKLDELIRVTKGAHTALLDIEELNEKELREMCLKYEKLAAESRKLMEQGKDDTSVPHIELTKTERQKTTAKTNKRHK